MSCTAFYAIAALVLIAMFVTTVRPRAVPCPACKKTSTEWKSRKLISEERPGLLPLSYWENTFVCSCGETFTTKTREGLDGVY